MRRRFYPVGRARVVARPNHRCVAVAVGLLGAARARRVVVGADPSEVVLGHPSDAIGLGRRVADKKPAVVDAVGDGGLARCEGVLSGAGATFARYVAVDRAVGVRGASLAGSAAAGRGGCEIRLCDPVQIGAVRGHPTWARGVRGRLSTRFVAVRVGVRARSQVRVVRLVADHPFVFYYIRCGKSPTE